MDGEKITADYKNALFAALRSGLNNERFELPEGIDAEKLLSIAAHQNLLPFVFMSLMSNKDFENTAACKKYLQRFLGTFSGQLKKTEKFLKLYRTFSDNGMYPVVVKGIILRQLYGNYADCRPSGDEDMLVKKSEFFDAVKILEDNGFVCKDGGVTEKQLETLHHLEFRKNGLHIELHSNLIDCRTELRRKMNSYFDSAAENAIFTEIKGVRMKTLNHTDHFLFLIFHAFNHFILSGMVIKYINKKKKQTGMGIRQMMDILVYYRSYADEIDMKYIEKALEDVHAKYFFSDLIRIGNKYLGFSIKPLCKEKDAEELLEDMLCMGVFGNSTSTHVAAGQMTSAAFFGGNTLLKTIFPTGEWLSRRFPEVIDKPYLIPVCWVKRWLRFLKGGKDKSVIGDSMAVGKRRIALLKKYGAL